MSVNVAIQSDGTLRLTQDLPFAILSMCGIRIDVIVPTGFVSDGASIPRLFWPIVGAPISGDHLEAAIIHDWFCVQAQSYRERRLGDSLFLYMLEDAGIAKWRRVAMYVAVRTYARLIWRPAR